MLPTSGVWAGMHQRKIGLILVSILNNAHFWSPGIHAPRHNRVNIGKYTKYCPRLESGQHAHRQTRVNIKGESKGDITMLVCVFILSCSLFKVFFSNCKP